MTDVNLRVKSKAGNQVISKLSLSLSIDQLKETLSKLTEIPTQRMKVLHGYPPQILDTSNGSESLHTLSLRSGLRSGDALIVEEDFELVTNGAEHNALEVS